MARRNSKTASRLGSVLCGLPGVVQAAPLMAPKVDMQLVGPSGSLAWEGCRGSWS